MDVDRERLLDLLLWYGVLGYRRADGEPAFIHTVKYDVKRLRALIKNQEGALVYCINPAFWMGLEIRQVT